MDDPLMIYFYVTIVWIDQVKLKARRVKVY